MQHETENPTGALAGILIRTFGSLMLIVAWCGATGCRQRQVGAVLTYVVQPQGTDAEAAKRSVVKTLNERLNGAGRVHSLAGAEVAVDLYGKHTPAELDGVKRLLGTPGQLAFRIIATPQDAEHRTVIDIAQQLPADKNAVEQDGIEVARWIELSSREFGDADQARTRGLIVRMMGATPQALVMVDEALDVTGESLQSASVDTDETGRPQVNFTLDRAGASKFGKLTETHLPTPAGAHYMLGVVLDDYLLSAPTIMSKISDRGRISGGAMSQEEVKLLINVLNAGTLPCPIQLRKSELAPSGNGD